jgi:hypothetical protein
MKIDRTLIASIENIELTSDQLTVHLTDGRVVSVPLTWYPRLVHASEAERKQWRMIGGGEGVHWPNLDEDISVENLLFGQRSGESQESLQRWLDGRSSPA